MPDRFDDMAAVAGAAAGLRPEQFPGFAHILRQVAAEEREACAKLADAAGELGTGIQLYAEINRLRELVGSAVAVLRAVATHPTELNPGYDHYALCRDTALTAAENISKELQ